MFSQLERQQIRRLDVVIPVYNSEKTIGKLVDDVVESLEGKYERLVVILVNDGSTDQSHFHALRATERHPGKVRYIQLMSNFGEHAAVLCGCRYSTGDAVVVIDDDFQNPPDEISGLVDKLSEGYDVVYAKYEVKHHSAFRNLASAFTNLVATWLLRKPHGLYLASFKVMNAHLVKVLNQYQGAFPFVDGIILRATQSIGTKLTRHDSRVVGKSNYTFSRLFGLWMNMFTGYSVAPLRIVLITGIFIVVLAVTLSVSLIATSLLSNGTGISPAFWNWAIMLTVFTLFAGLQLCALGLLGEYIGRLLLTASHTPQFVVRNTYGLENEPSEKSDDASTLPVSPTRRTFGKHPREIE